MNTALVTSLTKAKAYFGHFAQDYEVILNAKNRIAILNSKRPSDYKFMAKGMIGLVVYGVISAIVPTLAAKGWFTLLVGYILIAAKIAAAVFVSLVIFRLRKNKVTKENAEIDREIEGISAAYNNSHERLSKVYAQYERYVGEPCPLVFDYTTPALLDTFLEYARLGRADSVKEALNLFAVECHQNEVLRAQQDNLAQLAEIARQQERTTKEVERLAWRI